MEETKARKCLVFLIILKTMTLSVLLILLKNCFFKLVQDLIPGGIRFKYSRGAKDSLV